MALSSLVRAHEAAGRYLTVRGQRVFVREEGSGANVLLVHGVPTSSFLYRKVMPLVAARGLRAVAFDFPGLGLSDKPRGAPYDWHALAAWTGDIVAALDIAPVHLVIHDIGGPIAVEWASRSPEAVTSVTFLNTILNLAVFSRPFPMWLYVVPVLRHVVVNTQTTALFLPIMRRIGVKHGDRISRAEVAAYLELLRHNGGKRPFLDIMSGFDLSEAHTGALREGLLELAKPMQLVWGAHDFAIPRAQADYIRETFPLLAEHWVDGRHFIQEDQPEACAEHIADFCLALEKGE